MASKQRMRVLLVDDDAELCGLLSAYLSGAEFAVTAVYDGREGLQAALDSSIRLVLLDVMLPGLDGFEVLRQIRLHSAVPVIMLTARATHEDRISGFRGGADDYLPKPFHPEELVERCRALLRRSAVVPQSANGDVTHAGQLTLDRSTRQALLANEPLALTGMEFDILELLARSAGRVVGRDEIWAALYQRQASPFERSLDTHISNVRRKMAGRGGVTIRTVRNAGYMVAAE